MTRRDTILVAVLINAGLLIVLFISAIRTDKGATPAKIPSSTTVVQKAPKEPITPTNPLPNKTSQIVTAPKEQPQAPKKEIQQPIAKQVLTPAKTPQVEKPAFRVVKVVKGDVLEKIARRCNVSVSDIMKANNLSSSSLQIGQVLQVPLKAEPKKEESVQPKQQEGEYYVVKSGDSPWTIAKKNDIKVDELLRLNDLTAEKAKKLRPGDRLRIR